MTQIQPRSASKENELVGADCALCKAPFAPQDEVVVCPVDGVLHHTWCWERNQNRCTALGCTGHGPIGETVDEDDASGSDPVDSAVEQPPLVIPDPTTRPNYVPSHRPRPQPERARPPETALPAPQTAEPADPTSTPAPQSVPFAIKLSQSCLLFAVAVAILVMAFSCFGLWAILDYVMLDVLEWGYRPIP